MSDDAGRPRLWIVAGPNGCGKSTAYSRDNMADLKRSVWIINPDLLTARLREQEGLALEAANLAAVRRIESWLDASIEVHQTIGVETVLSTPKYRRLVDKAKAHGFIVRLTYVWLATAEMQIERIRLRVAKGGHHVPDDKVRERRLRSLEQLGWFFWAADEAWVYDNSSDQPELMVSKLAQTVELAATTPHEIVAALDLDRGAA